MSLGLLFILIMLTANSVVAWILLFHYGDFSSYSLVLCLAGILPACVAIVFCWTGIVSVLVLWPASVLPMSDVLFISRVMLAVAIISNGLQLGIDAITRICFMVRGDIIC